MKQVFLSVRPLEGGRSERSEGQGVLFLLVRRSTEIQLPRSLLLAGLPPLRRGRALLTQARIHD